MKTGGRAAPSTPATSKDKWLNAIAVLGFLIGLFGFLALYEDWVPKGLRAPARVSAAAILVVVSLYLLWWLLPASIKRRIQDSLERFAVWIPLLGFMTGLAGLVLIVLVYRSMGPKPAPTFAITFDRSEAGVFNSWDDPKAQPKYIVASGGKDMAWGSDGQGAFSFSYITDGAPPQGASFASSGAYSTFYDRPLDRAGFEEISFKCKADGFESGLPDFGIRLALDDPGAGSYYDRERVTYELPSISAYSGGRSISGAWQDFTVYVGDLKQTRFQPPLPAGMPANTINKIAFFVDSRMAKNCQKARLWFRDVVLR